MLSSLVRITLVLLAVLQCTLAVPLFGGGFLGGGGLGGGLLGGGGGATKSSSSSSSSSSLTSSSLLPTLSPTTTVAAPTTSSVNAATVATTTAATTTSAAATPTATIAQLHDKVRGVNLGGWFVLEAWMSPTLFAQAQKASGAARQATDQWTFMTQFSDPSKALATLSQHWSTWIVEDDFKQIRDTGLNTVRLPVPHWAFSPASSSEPYIAGAEVPYIDQAIAWAAKYDLDVILDLHTAPNSQNGYDSSGHTGSVGFEKTNGASNLSRFNAALTALVQRYVNDATYNGAVKYVEVLNEPLCGTLSTDFLVQVYRNSTALINAQTSSSALSVPTVMLHDCFATNANWKTIITGPLANTSFVMDTHRYHTFDERQFKTYAQHVAIVKQDGDNMAYMTNTLKRPALVGEFSLAISCLDCPTGNTANATQIATFNRRFFETQTAAYERGGVGWVFWSWRAEKNTPWSYRDALSMQWIPADPSDKSLAQQ